MPLQIRRIGHDPFLRPDESDVADRQPVERQRDLFAAPRTYSEEKLIVFSTVERQIASLDSHGCQPRGDLHARNLFEPKHGAHVTGSAEMVEVGGEPVGEINHGGGQAARGKPLR